MELRSLKAEYFSASGTGKSNWYKTDATQEEIKELEGRADAKGRMLVDGIEAKVVETEDEKGKKTKSLMILCGWGKEGTTIQTYMRSSGRIGVPEDPAMRAAIRESSMANRNAMALGIANTPAYQKAKQLKDLKIVFPDLSEDQLLALVQ